MSARRRALLIAVLALALAVVAWVASQVIGNTRISFASEGSDAGLTFATELPAGSCSKTFDGRFPWVHLSCEPRGDERREVDGGAGTNGVSTGERAEPGGRP